MDRGIRLLANNYTFAVRLASLNNDGEIMSDLKIRKIHEIIKNHN